MGSPDESQHEDLRLVSHGFWRHVSTLSYITPRNLTFSSAGFTTISRIPYLWGVTTKKDFFRKSSISHLIQFKFANLILVLLSSTSRLPCFISRSFQVYSDLQA